MLNSNFSSHIVSAIVEYTVFVIDESSVVDSYRSFSCLDNDEFCLDFWSQIYSQSVDELYQDSLCQIW